MTVLPPRRKNRRGQAATETALTMLVFIPIFLYALFLDDLLRFRQDLQETVTSTPWDFTTQNFVDGYATGMSGTPPLGEGSAVQHYARLMYCDHNSGRVGDYVDRGGSTDDCESEHHHGVTGHVCWLGQGEQITCEAPERGVGATPLDPIASRFHNAFTRGGMFRCFATSVTQNYLLPKTLFAEFSKVDQLTLNRWHGSGSGTIHGNATGGVAGTDTYIFARQQFAVMADPWATYDTESRRPGNKSSSPFYDRLENVWNSAGLTYRPAAAAFMAQLASNQLFIPSENVATPNLAVTPQSPGGPTTTINQHGSNATYYNTPWRDWASDPYRATYNDRQNYYLGCQNPESC